MASSLAAEDPETIRQIEELARDPRPLLVLDVDEVVLEFVTPFTRFLRARDLDLLTGSFRLTGNVVDAAGVPLERERVSALIDDFFVVQSEWQVAAPGAADIVADLARAAEVVMLTSMTHRHRATRRSHLDRLGFPYPLVTTDAAKGPALRRLRGESRRPVAFVDDIPNNLASARAAVADASLFHLMTHPVLRTLLPPLPDGVTSVADWREAGPKITSALRIKA